MKWGGAGGGFQLQGRRRLQITNSCLSINNIQGGGIGRRRRGNSRRVEGAGDVCDVRKWVRNATGGWLRRQSGRQAKAGYLEVSFHGRQRLCGGLNGLKEAFAGTVVQRRRGMDTCPCLEEPSTRTHLQPKGGRWITRCYILKRLRTASASRYRLVLFIDTFILPLLLYCSLVVSPGLLFAD